MFNSCRRLAAVAPRLRFRRLAATAACALLLIAVIMAGAAMPDAAAAQTAPGGFLESTTSTVVRANSVPTLPARGKFTFPAPYNTTGVRLTNSSDCGGSDCVDYIGYSYWRNMNNHVGSDEMLLFVTLDIARGGGGPTLFSYNKLTDQVTVRGPLFDPSSAFAWATGEGWYWSGTQPTKLYVFEGSRLYRYDVVTRQLQTVFDAASQFGANRYIWQIHSSNDDRVHSATLRDSTTYDMLGCLAYREDTKQFQYYPAVGDMDECQVDKSGRWLLIKDNVDGAYGEDNRIIDLNSGAETRFLDQYGAAGHSDNGFGYMVAEDNWHATPGAVRVWTFGQPLPGTAPQGQLVYHTTDWSVDAGHISHANARPGVGLDQQFACASRVGREKLPRANELVCFRLDGSLQVLVVAPLMTNLNAAGGGDDYAKMPKGNLDVTGQYFIWTSNTGGNRLDAFIVKVPSQLLVAGGGGTGGTGGGGGSVPPADPTPPTVAVTLPAAGVTVAGNVTVSATADDNVGVVGVQFKKNGVNLGPELTAAPYSLAWDTRGSADGSYSLTAVARDAAGNTTTSATRTISVANTPTGGGGGTGGGGTGGSGTPQKVVWTSIVNAAVNTSNVLRKAGGCSGCQDSGAVSQQRISGNGYMQFTASERTTLRYVGLSAKNGGTTASSIAFAFALQPGGVAEVREAGVYRAETPFVSGDVLRIAVDNGVVRYYKNGALIYQSKVTSLSPLMVDTSLLSTGSTVKNVVILAASSSAAAKPDGKRIMLASAAPTSFVR